MTALTAHPGRSALHRFIGGYGQEIVVLLSIVALFVVVGIINPRFLSDTNINSIFAGNAYIAIAAIGMSMVIIAGHIDVSVGALIGVIATIAGTLAVNGYPVWVAWVVPILFAMADTKMIHGTNEHMTLDNLARITTYYAQFIATAAG